MNRRVILGVAALLVLVAAGASAWLSRSAAPAAIASSEVAVVPGTLEGSRTPAPAERAGTASGSVGAVATTPNGSPAAARVPDDDDVRAVLPDPATDPRTLYRQVRTERRDPDWAVRSESGIKAALAAIPYIDRDAGPRISCAATLCEIKGTMAEGVSDGNAAVAMEALQGERLVRPLADAGLFPQAALFGTDGKTRSFVIYAKRR